MRRPMPPLSALRAFEAAARHLSLTSAARELHVTPGALSHQIRGLEELLGVKLFERRVRAIALTAAGKQLYPGLQTGFTQIRDAVASLAANHNPDILVAEQRELHHRRRRSRRAQHDRRPHARSGARGRDAGRHLLYSGVQSSAA